MDPYLEGKNILNEDETGSMYILFLQTMKAQALKYALNVENVFLIYPT